MVSVLAGLAQNTGLKGISFRNRFKLAPTWPTLWTICFKEIHPLNSGLCGNEMNTDSEMCSAVVKALLRTLRSKLPADDTEIPMVLVDLYGKR
jgi:hypothetical protein